MRRIIALSLAATLSVASVAVLAHGEEHNKAKNAAVKKEQKPWGIAGDAKSVKRTIKLSMTDDMRFHPDKLEFKQGETVRFVMTNNGKVMHEMVLGTQKELDEHAALMLKFPNMEHDEPYMAHVAPGKTGQIIWTFNRAGSFDFACLIAGHYQGGMRGKITVTSATAVK